MGKCPCAGGTVGEESMKIDVTSQKITIFLGKIGNTEIRQSSHCANTRWLLEFFNCNACQTLGSK